MEFCDKRNTETTHSSSHENSFHKVNSIVIYKHKAIQSRRNPMGCPIISSIYTSRTNPVWWRFQHGSLPGTEDMTLLKRSGNQVAAHVPRSGAMKRRSTNTLMRTILLTLVTGRRMPVTVVCRRELNKLLISMKSNALMTHLKNAQSKCLNWFTFLPIKNYNPSTILQLTFRFAYWF